MLKEKLLQNNPILVEREDMKKFCRILKKELPELEYKGKPIGNIREFDPYISKDIDFILCFIKDNNTFSWTTFLQDTLKNKSSLDEILRFRVFKPENDWKIQYIGLTHDRKDKIVVTGIEGIPLYEEIPEEIWIEFVSGYPHIRSYTEDEVKIHMNGWDNPTVIETGKMYNWMEFYPLKKQLRESKKRLLKISEEHEFVGFIKCYINDFSTDKD